MSSDKQMVLVIAYLHYRFHLLFHEMFSCCYQMKVSKIKKQSKERASFLDFTRVIENKVKKGCFGDRKSVV